MAEVVVLGAGMVGISSALALQERGHTVTVIDRRDPGTETSFGNAGVLQAEASAPYAMPRDLKTLWSLAMGHNNDLVWHLRDLPRFAPALLRYFMASSPKNHARSTARYAPMIARATADHDTLIKASGAGNLIAKNGLGIVHRDERSFDLAIHEAESYRRRFGLSMRVVSHETLRKKEPDFKPVFAGAILWNDSWSCSDPGGLVTAYARLFKRRGGDIVQGDAASLAQTDNGWQVTTQDGKVAGSNVVVALGPWSPALLAPFGYRIQMILKRGYHAHFKSPARLTRPYLDAENGIVMSSMRSGLRLTTGAELVHQNAPANRAQLDRGTRGVSDLLDVGSEIDDSLWFGSRPCLPDMVPIIGLAPKHKGLWFNFGHGHQGFTLGPTTGGMLADKMSEQI